MVRPSQERQTVPLTIAQSDLAGDGTESGEDVDIDAGGTIAGGGSGGTSPPAADVLVVVEDTDSGGVIIDVSEANWWDITLTADTTLAIANPPPANSVGQLHIILRQGPGCPWLVTWPAEVVWPDPDGVAGGSAPTLHTVEDAVDVITLTTEDGGTTWGGTYDSTGSSSAGLPWFDVTDYGATGDGSTDDTAAIQDTIDAAEAAGGGVVFFPAGVYIVGGALQDTSRSNSQLLLPRIDYVDSEQVTIELRGAFPPPPIMSVIGTTPVPSGQSIVKGTLNTAAGTKPALIGAHGPSGTFGDFTNLMCRIADLTFRMPSNPQLSALNLGFVGAVDIDNVVVDVGSYYVEGLTEPTTSASTAIVLPTNNNGAYTRLGAVNVIGFYTGYEYSEHTQGEYVAAWGCKIGHKFLAADNHSSHFDRMAYYHCERGIQATGTHYVAIDELNVEHAATGWWVTDYDIDDAASQLHGHLSWHVVLAGVGIDSTFTVNFATNMHLLHLGDNPYGSPSFATPSILLSDSAAGGASGSTIRADSTIAAFNDSADPTTIDWDDVADPGDDDFAARRDHRHGMQSDPGGGSAHYLVIADVHSTPLIFGDLVQTEAGDDLVYTD